MRSKKIFSALLAVVLGTTLSVVVGARPASAGPSCVDTYVVFARGSGAEFGSRQAVSFRTHITGVLQGAGWAELGNLDQNEAIREGYEYPAVPVDDPKNPAIINGGYSRSVTTGKDELVTHLNDRASRCPTETTVIGGYSQGADVVGWALRSSELGQAAKNHIGFVALYGDPKFDAGRVSDRRNGVNFQANWWWVRGDDAGYRGTEVMFPNSGILGARSPYVPEEFRGRFGSWCAARDGMCNGTWPLGMDVHTNQYQGYWMGHSMSEIVGAVVSKHRQLASTSPNSDDQLYHGTPPNGALVENADGGNHKYVAIGGSLVWIPPTENIWDYVHQMQRLHPSGQFHDILRMRSDEIHAMEYGFGGNRAHVPDDNSFLYEHGSQQQYVVHYGHTFAIGTAEEVDYLGGRDRAVMVPAGTASRMSGVPPIPNDVLLKSLINTTVYHQVNGLAYRVPGVPTLDCIRTVKHGSVQPVTASLLAVLQNAGRLTAQPTSCDFTHGQVLVGQPSNRQAIMLYGAGFAIGSPQEAVAIGAANRAVPVSDETVNGLIARTPSIPQGHVFRAGLDTKAYHYVDAKFHHIGSPATRDCLLARGSLGTGEEIVPASFIGRYPTGPPAYCELENRQLLAPNGVTVGYVQDGFRRPVTNPAIRDCIAVRRGAGAPLAVTDNVWNSYTPGPNAYCPYEREKGLNFVQEAGSPTVWLVQAPTIPGQPATKRHVGSLCVPDPYTTQLKQYHVWTVPVGETGGHVQGEDWWADGPKCQGLPQG